VKDVAHRTAGRARPPLIEDDENDVFFFERAASITNPMQIIRDGREAMDYIGGTGKFLNREQRPLPAEHGSPWSEPAQIGRQRAAENLRRR
jgi:hypothetical protein